MSKSFCSLGLMSGTSGDGIDASVIQSDGDNEFQLILDKYFKYSEDIYKNFELELEWKVPIGGNSGIFYYATEEGDYIWQSAPEMQVLDNDLHTDGKNTLTSAGSLYAMIAPSNAVVKPVGEFNKVRIKVKDNKVEHWLNGTKIVEYVYGSEAMWELVANSKFSTKPLFAKASEGHIGFQGDHGEIWYRNIRIRNL